ncbi:MAG: hypothetical protein HY728_02075 [Candidatus Rokubacteria bacterium]|nr:hypothetical protein [Candidatus Rokubacteria bacterium]
MKTVAAILVAAFAALCLGDIAQAAMAGSQNHDCAGRVCDEQAACSAATPAQALSASHALPVGTLPALDGLVTLKPAAVIAAFPRSEVAPDRQVVPLAPRSPPVTS